MINSGRTYRFFAVLLASSMMLGVGLPTLQQVCTMAEADASSATSPVICLEDATVKALCDEETSPYDGVAAHEGCCRVEAQDPDAPEALLWNRLPEQKLTLSLLFLVVTPVLPEPGEKQHVAFPSSFSAPFSISLHVLHATFLN